MCGICGIIDYKGGFIAEQTLNGMMQRLHHRGPDDKGHYINSLAALGHCRLSIIDLNTGHQPIASADGSAVIVFNGEIYNYRELKQQLVGHGYSFRTESDTEVILNAYLHYGRAVANYLNGDFAFAIWDNRDKTLFVARDRLGLKPFFYYYHEKLLIFASEIKAILVHPAIKQAEIDKGALGNYLFAFYTLGDETFFQGIKTLPAGHTLVCDAAGLDIHKYWDIRSEAVQTTDHAGYVNALIKDAVAGQLQSDVPLGISLSGGLDSSVVCAAMSIAGADEINSYTVSYPDNIEYFSKNQAKTYEGVTGDDTHYAQLVADRYATRHTKLILKLDSYAEHLDRVIWHREKPSLVMSEFGHFNLSLAIKKYITVLLTGQGGDEIFGGYYYWLERRTAENTDYFPWVMRLDDGAEQPNTTYDWMKYLLRESLRKSASFVKRGEDFFHKYLNDFQTEDFRNQLSYMLVKIHLQELLDVEDRLGMASSVEIRCPLCDYRVVEYLFNLPFDTKFKKNAEKMLLKDAFKTALPPEILSRKKSQFPIPMESENFYRQVADFLTGKNLYIHEYFEPDRIKVLCEELLNHPRSVIKYVAFRLYALERWHRIFITGGQQF